MSTGIPIVTPTLDIETKELNLAPGVSLSENAATITRSILDLFAGHPSLAKLALWRDDATFTDPLTIATGRDRYAAQWYGLTQAFSHIEQLHHQVKDGGNPILVDLRMKYVVRGLGKEQVVNSVVAIFLDGRGKVERVEDRWGGKLPEGKVANVSFAVSLLEGVGGDVVG